MPAPTNYQTPGGVGLPAYSGPGQDLSVQPADQRPRTERIDQLKSLLFAAGGAIAGAVGSEARIENLAAARAKERQAESAHLYQWVQQRKADEDNERQAAYRSGMKDRVHAVEQAQFDILRDNRSVNEEWVLNESVMRQNNAAYPEEKSAWNDFIINHQTAARNDAKQEAAKASRVANATIISDRRIASRTAKNAIDSLSNEVTLDPKLREQLIGDGKGIAERVSTYTIKTAMQSAPQLFDLDKKDPFYAEKLEQQTILLDELDAHANNSIVAPLTRQYVANTNKAMEETGNNRVEVAAQAFAEGKLTKDEYHDVVGDVLRTNFAHVDPNQRDNLRQKLYANQFNRLATLVDQPDPGLALQRMEDLLSIADLNINEKQVIREQIISDKFPKAIKERLQQTIQQKMAEMSGITKIGDQSLPKDPKTISVEMLENGTYRDIAGQMLDKLGITGDPSTMTPLQNNLLGVITGTVMEVEKQALAAQGKAMVDVNRASRFLSGAALTSEESNTQWQNGGLMRLFMGNLSVDDPVFQELAQTYKAKTGKDFPWDGTGPIPLDQDSLPIVQDVATQEGRAWAKNSITSIPRAMANTIENMALYESPERAQVALSFWQGLGPEGQERVGKDLSARAQMVMMEGNRLANHDPVGRGLAMTEIANRMRNIDQNTATAALRLAKDQAGLSDVTPDPRFHYDYATALSGAIGKDMLKDEYGSTIPGFDFNVPRDFFDSLGTSASQGLSNVFGRQNLVPLYAQMAVVQLGNPGISLDQAAVVVVARMREQQYKVVDGAAGKQIIQDPWGHFPTDVTPAVLMKQQLASPMTREQAERFIARIPNAGPETSAMARDGILPADILWSHMQEQESLAGGKPANIPYPGDWAFLPETQGEVFSGTMSQANGGVPMHVVIPGVGRTQMLTDREGNPLLVVSSKDRIITPTPVDRSKIPDYFLTPYGRRKIPLKPDSAGRMEEMLRTLPQDSGRVGGRNVP